MWGKVKDTDEFVNQLREQGIEWRENLQNLMLDYYGFNIEECLKGINVQWHTRKFLLDLQALLGTYGDWQTIEKQLCRLAENQERQNKKSKSRFVKLEKQQVVDDMSNQQWLGLPLLEYRYLATKRILTDIYQGLE